MKSLKDLTQEEAKRHLAIAQLLTLNSTTRSLVLLYYGLMRPREGWTILPFGFLFMSTNIASYPVLGLGVSANEVDTVSQRYDLLRSILEKIEQETVDRKRALLNAAKLKLELTLHEFISGLKPFRGIASLFYGDVVRSYIADDLTQDTIFILTPRTGVKGGLYLVTARMPTDLVDNNLISVTIPDIVYYYKWLHSIQTRGEIRTNSIALHRLTGKQLEPIKKLDTYSVDDIVDYTLSKVEIRITSNAVMLAGLDKTKYPPEEIPEDIDQKELTKTTFLAPARRVLRIPDPENIEQIDLIYERRASAAIVVLWYRELDTDQVKTIQNIELPGLRPDTLKISEEEDIRINMKLRKTFYGKTMTETEALKITTGLALLEETTETPKRKKTEETTQEEQEGNMVPVVGKPEER